MTRQSDVMNTKIRPTERGPEQNKPDLERPPHVGPQAREQDDGEDLADELHQNPRRDERVNNHASDRRPAIAMRPITTSGIQEALGRVHAAEDLKEIRVARRRVPDPGIAEEQREHRPERRPENQRGKRVATPNP